MDTDSKILTATPGLSVHQVARRLRVSFRTVRKWIDGGQLKAVPGMARMEWFVSEADLGEFCRRYTLTDYGTREQQR
jgi:excisionase family DNA binding protein